MRDTDRYAAQLHYETLTSRLTLSPLWRRYLATLAAVLYGEDAKAGAAFLERPDWPAADPLKAAESEGLLSGENPQDLRSGIWLAQAEVCLPAIERERCAFIKMEHGRLQGVMNSDYWDEKKKESRLFHPVPSLDPEIARPGDPYDLSLEELALLPTLVKRVERIGTYSYLALFHADPKDGCRLPLLARIRHELTHASLPAAEDVDYLLRTHEEYMEWKLADTVKVILSPVF